MKVLGGCLGGRKIKAPFGVRPVSQRVKKSCFDILAEEAENKSILDLYAGSGSLGIEALSRGAKAATFVDFNQGSLKVLEKNISQLNIREKSTLYCKDSLEVVRSFHAKSFFFDLIFLDPPYNKGLLTKSLQLIGTYDILARSGYLIGFCYKKEARRSKYGSFSLVLERDYGQTVLLIYRKDDEKSNLSGDI